MLLEIVPSPTPEEILQRCEDIQREWSDVERRRRAGSYSTAGVEIPTAIDMDDGIEWE